MGNWVTEEMLARARDEGSGLTREERRAVFNDADLERTAANARYPNGRSVKETVDPVISAGGKLSFARLDKLGREYAKMAARRREEEAHESTG